MSRVSIHQPLVSPPFGSSNKPVHVNPQTKSSHHKKPVKDLILTEI